MAYSQRPSDSAIVSRVQPQVEIGSGTFTAQDRAEMRAEMGQPAPGVPWSPIEIIRVTTTYAPINAAGARKPGCSDTREVEVLAVLTSAEAARLAQSLVSDLVKAAPVLPFTPEEN